MLDFHSVLCSNLSCKLHGSGSDVCSRCFCSRSSDGHFIDDPLDVVNVKPDFDNLGLFDSVLSNLK